MKANAPPSPTASARAAAQALAAPAPPVFKLGAPLPAPVESPTPPLYQTPGMPEEGATATTETSAGRAAVKPDGEPIVDPATLSPVFVPDGRIYGAPSGQPSSVTLQALKGVSLIVR